MSGRDTIPGRALWAALAALACLTTTAGYAQFRIRETPASPRPIDPIVVTIDSWDAVADPCIAWQISDRSDRTIRIEGTPANPHCPHQEQHLEVGQLDEGRYTIAARIAGQANPVAEVRIDVRASPEVPSRPYDIALSQPSPVAGEPFAFTLSASHGVCDPLDFTTPPDVVGDRIVLNGRLYFCPFEPIGGADTDGFRHALPPLSAGNKTIEVQDRGILIATFGFHVDQPPTVLAAAGGAFEASLRWSDRKGVVHDAHATSLTEESGQFWFFEPGNPEVTIKLIDGTGLNGHWWVFASSLTDLAFTLTVHSNICFPGSCVRERRYVQAAGRNRNFIDTSAFRSATSAHREGASGRP